MLFIQVFLQCLPIKTVIIKNAYSFSFLHFHISLTYYLQPTSKYLSWLLNYLFSSHLVGINTSGLLRMKRYSMNHGNTTGLNNYNFDERGPCKSYVSCIDILLLVINWGHLCTSRAWIFFDKKLHRMRSKDAPINIFIIRIRFRIWK